MNIYAFALVMTASFFMQTTSSTQIMEDLKRGFETKNIDLISKHFKEEVKMEVNHKKVATDRHTAAEQIRILLRDAGKIEFSIRHEGRHNQRDSQYHIARLTTANTAWRVFIYLEKDDNNLEKVREISFEKD